MGQMYTSCLAALDESEAEGMPGLRAGKAERTPLFASVGAKLKREIASGRFAKADFLPGERELSEMLDVSRTTLRRAIAGLIDEGVLVHRHGAGTFVRRNPPHVEQPLSRLTSFTEDMRLRGLAPSSRVIERGTFLPTPEESMMLDIALAEPVFRLERLRLADGVPMALERAAVPLRFLNGTEPGGDSLYAALEAAGFRPVRAIERLRAVVVGTAEAALLGVPEGAAALDIQRVAYAADGRRVEFTRSAYRSDTYDFVAELALSPSARMRTEGAAR
jgi:GntR family transcriptional regulator, N-acetylglucosamine utilization regulator